MTEQKKYPNLEVLARTIQNDLKCEPEVAMNHAIKGAAVTARAVGIKVSDKPTADEIEKVLVQHWEKLGAFIESGQKTEPSATAKPRAAPKPVASKPAAQKPKR